MNDDTFRCSACDFTLPDAAYEDVDEHWFRQHRDRLAAIVSGETLARRMWMAEPLWRRAWMRVEYRYWPRLLGLFRS